MTSSSIPAEATTQSLSSSSGSTISISSSKWGIRFENKLHTLGETSSKETYLTIAKWIEFNRKRFIHKDLIPIFQKNLINNTSSNTNTTTTNTNRQLLYLQLINEILLDEKGTSKWERYNDLRIFLGEKVLLQIVDQLNSVAQEKLTSVYLKEWDDSNVFDGPTLIHQMKRKIIASKNQQKQQQQSKEKEPGADEAAENVKADDTDVITGSDVVEESANVTTKVKNTDQQQEKPEKEKDDEEQVVIAVVADTTSSIDETLEKKVSDSTETNVLSSDSNNNVVESVVTATGTEQKTATTATAACPEKLSSTSNQQTNIVSSDRTASNDDDHNVNHDDDDERIVIDSGDVPDAGSNKKSDEDNNMDDVDEMLLPKYDKVPDVSPPLALLPSSNHDDMSSLLSSSATTTAGTTVYDFDKTGIAQRKVEPREFLEHCKSIATLQIARDLRNDGAVQLSSLLSSMPEDIRKLCDNQAEQKGGTPEATSTIPEVQARDFSIRINEALLHMDMNEQLNNVQTFYEIINRQKIARQQLISLLVQSRCLFGSNDSAKEFYNSEKMKNKLKKRSQILTDAMELEGFDMMDDNDDTTNNKKGKSDLDEGLAPLTWYANQSTSLTKGTNGKEGDNVVISSVGSKHEVVDDGSTTEHDTKRQKID